MRRPVACKSCGALFIRNRVRNDQNCSVCHHEGRAVEYVTGEEKQQNWYSFVELEAEA